VLKQSKAMTVLELVQALEKCQTMAIKATLLPQKAGKDEGNPLDEMRKKYFREVNRVELVGGLDGETISNQAVRGELTATGDGL
jgi:hypothetical protein